MKINEVRNLLDIFLVNFRHRLMDCHWLVCQYLRTARVLFLLSFLCLTVWTGSYFYYTISFGDEETNQNNMCLRLFDHWTSKTKFIGVCTNELFIECICTLSDCNAILFCKIISSHQGVYWLPDLTEETWIISVVLFTWQSGRQLPNGFTQAMITTPAIFI